MPDQTLSERQMEVLIAICDTLAPALHSDKDSAGLFARKASDLNVASHITEALTLTHPHGQQLFRQFLDLLDQPLVNLFLGSDSKSFLDMTLEERTATLRQWEDSRFLQRREVFQAVKRLVLFFFYSVLDDTGSNPNWPAIGYPMPLDVPVPETLDQPIKPLEFAKDTVLSTDVVIIGSGAGGGVVAGELSAAGLDVIVLEKGGYADERHFDRLELSGSQRLFENQGFVATRDLGVVVLAGSTLGGGTTVNWCASFRTPDPVLHEWAHVYGVTGFTGAEYQQALDTVSKRINVNELESIPNPQNSVLERGSQALGYAVNVIPRNVNGCGDGSNCGFCNFGCRLGAKQGTLRTYLYDAYKRGTRIAVNTAVDRVLIEKGEAVGVVATSRTPDGQPVRVTVKARVVVVAAGALHTPAVLLRSGLTNAHIGRNLHLHPTSTTFGVFDEQINGWNGVPMSRYVPQFNDLHNHYGVALETAPIYPGIAAMSLSWANGAQHKRVMQQLAHLSNIIIITRDQGSGQITVDEYGKPIIDYRLADEDKPQLIRGIIESLRILRAAGAREVSAPHTIPLTFRTDEGGDFEAFLRKVEAAGLRTNSFALFSAHQMSSCHMGGNPVHGAIDPSGETFEVRNLYVADASALPTSVGVNPMLTIMGVSYQIAQHIKAKVGH